VTDAADVDFETAARESLNRAGPPRGGLVCFSLRCTQMPEGAPTVTAFVALGSNLGDRQRTLREAIAAMASLPATRLLARSEFLETRAVGPPQPAYLNAAVSLDTTLRPAALLNSLLAIERAHGRTRARETRWGARTLDLDLLLYGDLIVREPGLTVPHPRLHERRFVLEPLAQIAPGLRIPTLGRTVEEALRALGPVAPGNHR
jgi:2-amino-4-hydroxy-6-hydroxymethyldihydropteridine diphosphokinase